MNSKIVEILLILSVTVIVISAVKISTDTTRASQELYSKKGLIACHYNRKDYWLKPEQCVSILTHGNGK